MKKVLLVILLFFALAMPVSAETGDFGSDILTESGAGELEAGEFLEDAGISFDKPDSILNLTPSEGWELVKSTVADKLYGPVRLFTMILVLIIIASLMEGTGGTLRSGELSKIFELICVLSCVAMISLPLCECLDSVTKALSDGGKYMLGFVPVFSGITAAGGNVTSASGYSFLVLGFADVAVKVSESLLVPLLSMCISLGIVDSCCTGINLGGMVNAVRKIVTWGLGLVMTVFTGLLSVRSVVGASVDSVSSRTAKYLISNSVPLVGAAASEAYASVKGSLLLLRNGIGGIGIIALAVMLLPPLIHMILYKLCFGALGAVSEVFGTKKLSALFKNINAVLSAALGILVCFTLMFIVSTGIVMTLCTGT